MKSPDSKKFNLPKCNLFQKAKLEQIARIAQVEASMLDMVRFGIGQSLARQPVAIREAEAHGLVVLESLPLPSNLFFITAAQHKDDPIISAAFGVCISLNATSDVKSWFRCGEKN